MSIYKDIGDFKSEYTGIWGPSDGHFLGLGFSYKGNKYRFETGNMYEKEDLILSDGEKARFYLYKKVADFPIEEETNEHRNYEMLGAYHTTDEALLDKSIDGKSLEEVLLADETEELEKD